MKKVLSITAAVLISLSLSAQVVIEETAVKIGPITTPAYTATSRDRRAIWRHSVRSPADTGYIPPMIKRGSNRSPHTAKARTAM